MDTEKPIVRRFARSIIERRIGLTAALLGCIAAGPYGVEIAAAQVNVYRCTAADGSIEFRQQACRDTQDSLQVEIGDTRTGWTPPSGEVAPTPTKKPAAGKKRATTAGDTDKYADRCWNKRQQIERINTELRTGYRPQRGVKLRRRRAEHEAFLSRYCR